MVRDIRRKCSQAVIRHRAPTSAAGCVGVSCALSEAEECTGAPSWRPWLPRGHAPSVCLYTAGPMIIQASEAARKKPSSAATRLAALSVPSGEVKTPCASRPQDRHPKGHRQGAAPGLELSPTSKVFAKRPMLGPSGGGLPRHEVSQASPIEAGDGDPPRASSRLRTWASSVHFGKAGHCEPRTTMERSIQQVRSSAAP